MSKQKETIRERLVQMVALRTKINSKPEAAAIAFELCRRDILYYFDNFAFTRKDAKLFDPEIAADIPMVLFPYQREFVVDAWEAIQEAQKPVHLRKRDENGNIIPTHVFSEKSRQMGFSWLFAHIEAYAWRFHGISSLYVSKDGPSVDTSGDVNSQFGKIRYIIDKWPRAFLPAGFSTKQGTDHNKLMLVSDPSTSAVIKGSAASGSAGRSGTFGFAVLDEMAFMQNDKDIADSVAPTTSCIFYNSTPYGKGNEYYRIREMTIKLGVCRYHRAHWREHPYKTQEWFDNETRGWTPEKIAQELEIDYDVALEGRIYKEFLGELEEFEFEPEWPLYVSIDNGHNGTDPNALIVVQRNPHNGMLHVLDCISAAWTVEQFSLFLAGTISNEISRDLNREQYDFFYRFQAGGYKRATFLGDPYDMNQRVAQDTIRSWYRKAGIQLNRPMIEPKDVQIQKTRGRIRDLKVHTRCSAFADAILNARWTETFPAKPLHDWTSHYRTALEYLVCFLDQNRPVSEDKPRLPQRVFEKKDFLT
jgi:hypothetical protein